MVKNSNEIAIFSGIGDNIFQMFEKKVAKLLEQALDREPSLFLVDFSIGPDNKIRIVVDGDQDVALHDCIRISRAIEHNLDREEEDFALEVTSAGASSPIQMPRQYNKNVGRKLAVRTETLSYEGTLSTVTDKGIVLEWKAREPKPIGKGKVTVRKQQEIQFSDIKEAKVILKF